MIPSRYVVRTTLREAIGALCLAAISQARDFWSITTGSTHLGFARPLASHDWWAWLELAVLILAALGLADAAIRLFLRPERVVLDVLGVRVLDHSDETIPWGAVARISQKGNALWLTLRDPDRYPRTGWGRWRFPGRRKRGDIAIVLNNEKKRGDLLEAFRAWRPSIVGDG